MRAKDVLSYESPHALSSAPEVPNPQNPPAKNNLHSLATQNLEPFAAPASDPDLGGLKKPISVRLVDAGSLPAERAPSRHPGAAALQACYLKSLELDENCVAVWSNLGYRGGGTVKGQAYDKKDRRGA